MIYYIALKIHVEGVEGGSVEKGATGKQVGCREGKETDKMSERES